MKRKSSEKNISTIKSLEKEYLKYFSQQPNSVKPNSSFGFEIVDQYDYTSRTERHIGTGDLATG